MPYAPLGCHLQEQHLLCLPVSSGITIVYLVLPSPETTLCYCPLLYRVEAYELPD